MLGEIAWTPSDTTKSVGEIIQSGEAEKAGNERFEYIFVFCFGVLLLQPGVSL